MKVNAQNTSLKITAGLQSQFPRDGRPQIIFSGRSNVGKSSLLNVLVGRKALARVSSSPGKTITVNFYDVDGKFYFVDLPGYGYAKRAPGDKKRWSALTDAYLTGDSGCRRMVFQLIDMKAGPTADDFTMLDYLESTGTPYIIIATKCDKLNKTDRTLAEEELKKLGAKLIPFSALKGDGKNEIWSAVSEFLDR